MTLSAGVISASELNTEFTANTSTLRTQAQTRGKDWQVEVDVLDLIGTGGSATAASLRQVDFTAPDDLAVIALVVGMHNPDTTSRTITATLTAISSDGTDVSSIYLLGQDISESVTGATAAEHTERLTYDVATVTRVFLVKGLTYRLTLSSNSGTAVDRATGILVCRSDRRRA